MDIGISSACFYPLETEKSFREIGKMGIKKAEIFFNSPDELCGKVFGEILKIKECYGIEVTSIHPCTSVSEPVFFFSDYERRFYYMLDFYKRYFEACAKLDADTVIIHGMRTLRQISHEVYYERFAKMCQAGKEYGIKVSQENVFEHASGDPSFLKEMKEYLKDDFSLVFDVKQMRRCGFTENDFLGEFIDDIIHVHISDSLGDMDCLPPGEGDYDLRKMLKRLKDNGFEGTCLIELYKSGYEEYSQLKRSYEYLRALL